MNASSDREIESIVWNIIQSSQCQQDFINFLSQEFETGIHRNDAINALLSLDESGIDELAHYPKVVEALLTLADSGSFKAQSFLGQMYDFGTGVNKNIEAANGWYFKAAKGNEYRAISNLGTNYQNGCGLTKNVEKAMECFQLAGELGSTVAIKNLGCLYASLETEEGFRNAYELFKKAWGLGDPNGAYRMAEMHAVGAGYGIPKNIEKAFELNLIAAEGGCAMAACWLGNRYQRGEGIQENLLEAANWYALGAKQGHSSCQVNLANMFICGRGVERNPEKAVWLLKQSALLGNKEAMRLLGCAHYFGLGVTVDEHSGLDWLYRAAQAGSGNACFNLAEIIATLKTSDASESATHWLRIGADLGDSQAQFALAEALINGTGIPKDPVAAFDWAVMAGKQLNGDALFLIGQMHAAGVGTEVDYKLATLSYRVAAELGIARAKLALGLSYLLGSLGETDDELGVSLITEAAQSGDTDAIAALGQIQLDRGQISDAIKNFTIAAEQNHAESQYELGRLYGLGKDVSLDLIAAKFWMGKAAASGHKKANEWLTRQ
jgi:TPR repeat protein